MVLSGENKKTKKSAEVPSEPASAPATLPDEHVYRVSWKSFGILTAVFLFFGVGAIYSFHELVGFLWTRAASIAAAVAVFATLTFVAEVVALTFKFSRLPSRELAHVSKVLQTYFADLGYVAGFCASFLAFVAKHMVVFRDAATNVVGGFWQIAASVFAFEVGFVSYAKGYANTWLVYAGACLIFIFAEAAAIYCFPQAVPAILYSRTGALLLGSATVVAWTVFILVARHVYRIEIHEFLTYSQLINAGANVDIASVLFGLGFFIVGACTVGFIFKQKS